VFGVQRVAQMCQVLCAARNGKNKILAASDVTHSTLIAIKMLAAPVVTQLT
jgi:hypothetical protein